MIKNNGCTNCKESSINNTQRIDFLINLFPFLKTDFRELKENEIQKEAVFKELFPDNTTVDFGLLKAIYEFQRLKNTRVI